MKQARQNLIILHYHLRPGGVTQVIRRAIPILTAHEKKLTHLYLAGGEEIPSPSWLPALQKKVAPLSVLQRVDLSLNYFSEQRCSPAKIRQSLRCFLNQLFEEAEATTENTVVWAHNLGLARNVLLSAEISNLCLDKKIPLLSQHHDLWFDNRWQHWRAAKKAGCKSEAALASIIFPNRPGVVHAAINQQDEKFFHQFGDKRSLWLPNVSPSFERPPEQKIQQTRAWLTKKINLKKGSESRIWLNPCRLLRRKNLLEALLLMRWFDPQAELISAGEASSEQEHPYARRIAETAKKEGWPLHLAILSGTDSTAPGIEEMMAASDVLALTSLQEGFGLTFLEAAFFGKPIVCRELPNVGPDLAKFGFQFPLAYTDVAVARTLFDEEREIRCQEKLWLQWKNELPASVQPLAEKPELLISPDSPSVSFSRLSLTAQIEVLMHAPQKSRQESRPFNQKLNEAFAIPVNEFPPIKWPTTAAKHLSAEAWAANFQRGVHQAKGFFVTSEKKSPAALQKAFMASNLRSANIFPLLLETDL